MLFKLEALFRVDGYGELIFYEAVLVKLIRGELTKKTNIVQKLVCNDNDNNDAMVVKAMVMMMVVVVVNNNK